LLDALLMGLVVAMTVVGLQAAGLILVVALLVTPAAAARYWARRLGPQTGISAVIGAASAFVGASFSAVYPKLPAGAVIVLTAAAVFVVSLLFGRRGGWLWRRLEAVALGRRVESQHLLRTVFELAEVDGWMEALQDFAVPAERLGREQGWSAARTRRALARASRRDLVCLAAGGGWKLTPEGAIEARAAVRNHRLWELYLLSHADTAPAHVDRGADRIEHILHPALIERLERTLATEYGSLPIPANPHAPPPEPD
jgi:manganese/zinc/iron transport system permease protein